MLAHRKRPPTQSGGKHKPARRVGVCRPTAALRPLADAGASPRGPRLAFDPANVNENNNIFRARLFRGSNPQHYMIKARSHGWRDGPMGDRLTVGLRTLTPPMLVRIQLPQP